MHSYWRERVSRLPSTIVLKSVFIFSTIESRTTKLAHFLLQCAELILTLLLDLPVGEGLSSIIHQQNKRDVKCNVVSFKLTAAVSVASALPYGAARFAASRPSLPVPELLTADARNRISLIIQAEKRSSALIWRPPGVITAICWARPYSLSRVRRRPSIFITVWWKRPRALARSGGFRRRGRRSPGRDCCRRLPYGDLYPNAAGGDLLVPSPSTWQNRQTGRDGAGRAGADF